MSGRKIIIQIHYFFIKSDILNIHITNLIHRIADSFNSLNLIRTCKGGQNHGVKVSINSTFL